MPEFIYFKDEKLLFSLQGFCAHEHSDDKNKANVFYPDLGVYVVGVSLDEIVAALNNPANTDRVIVI
jgi:hypothetical protein